MGYRVLQQSRICLVERRAYPQRQLVGTRRAAPAAVNPLEIPLNLLDGHTVHHLADGLKVAVAAAGEGHRPDDAGLQLQMEKEIAEIGEKGADAL